MTLRVSTEKTKHFGSIISQLRLASNGSSREKFLEDVADAGLLPPNWLSIKSLANIENGYNIPSLKTLKYLAIALNIDFIDLIQEIEPYIE
jgi:transcriptional regulator with XRE-family HTH domain